MIREKKLIIFSIVAVFISIIIIIGGNYIIKKQSPYPAFDPYSMEYIASNELEKNSFFDLLINVKTNAEAILANKNDPLIVPILMYHSIDSIMDTDSDNVRRLKVSPDSLDQQLAYLQVLGFTTISMDEFVSYQDHPENAPVHPIILTFDDGWKSQYTKAFPILKKYNFKAVFYIYTNAIGIRNFMSWEDVGVLLASGMQIGSHSLSHPFLTRLSRNGQELEIKKSKEIIEKKTNNEVTSFAFPFGDRNKNVEKYIAITGYSTARIVNGNYATSLTNYNILPGREIGDSVSKFKIYIDDIYNKQIKAYKLRANPLLLN